MKARRLVVLALALVTVLTMGVGYAALNDALTVGGTGSLTKTAADQQFNGEVYFTDVPTTTNCTATLNAPTDEDGTGKPDSATITIANTLAIVGDTATATFTVQNDSQVPATIVTDSSNDSTHFRVTCEYTAGNTIPAGGTLDITVKVTLKTTVADDVPSESFGISFNVTSAG